MSFCSLGRVFSSYVFYIKEVLVLKDPIRGGIRVIKYIAILDLRGIGDLGDLRLLIVKCKCGTLRLGNPQAAPPSLSLPSVSPLCCTLPSYSPPSMLSNERYKPLPCA